MLSQFRVAPPTVGAMPTFAAPSELSSTRFGKVDIGNVQQVATLRVTKDAQGQTVLTPLACQREGGSRWEKCQDPLSDTDRAYLSAKAATTITPAAAPEAAKTAAGWRTAGASEYMPSDIKQWALPALLMLVAVWAGWIKFGFAKTVGGNVGSNNWFGKSTGTRTTGGRRSGKRRKSSKARAKARR